MRLVGIPLLVLLITVSVIASPQSAQQTGRGGGGAPVQGAEPDIPLVGRFDVDKDTRLNRVERLEARQYMAAHPELRRPARGTRPTRTGTPGPAVRPGDVATVPDTVSLYDPSALRTLFLEFDDADWEDELAAFYHTDVLVPARLEVDGKVYRDIGVSFRGNNSFTAVPAGLKRPLSLTMDFVHGGQDLLGHNSLNLLNSNQDPTLLRSVLFLDIARQYLPAVQANFVRVVINGELWGVYVNQQTFSTRFLRDSFKTSAGTRWKSPNNSVGGGLSYLGDDIALYRKWYEMKGDDDVDAWRALVDLTRLIRDTPVEHLEAALAPVMDVDAVLRYLALDVALVNNDGYWRDGSDFNLYRDPKGRFMLTLHDANEGFRAGGRGGAAQPEPLTTLDDPNKALRHKLLAVPALRDRYLAYVGDIADKWLDWKTLGPIVERYRTLIGADVARETRKLDTTEAFTTGVYGPGDGTPPPATTIKGFADSRREALLAHPDILRVRSKIPVAGDGIRVRPQVQTAPPPDPRRPSAAGMHIYTPTQHDLYDGHFVISANRLYMVGGLNDPEGWDHLDNDAKTVHPVAGTAEIDVNEVSNTGTFVAKMRIPEGDLVLIMDRWHEFHPCQDGGIAAYVHEHGADSGCGDNNWPKTLGFLAGWGYGRATLNGRPLYADYEMHFMVTQGLRDRKTLRVLHPMSNAKGPAGATNPAMQQIDFYIRSPQVNPKNRPGREVFAHFFGMEITWK